MYPDFFSGSELLAMQKLQTNVIYFTEQFVGTIKQEPEYYAVVDVLQSKGNVPQGTGHGICINQSET